MNSLTNTNLHNSHHNVNKPTLKIAAINVNLIIANYRRYELVMFTKQHKHDTILLSETKVNHKYKLMTNIYDVVRSDRPKSTQSGGTVIVIKKGIQYRIVNYPTSKNNKILEFTLIKMQLTNNASLYIASTYATNDNRGLFTQKLKNLLTSIKANMYNVHYIIAGDLNIKLKDWGNQDNNQRGMHFMKWEPLAAAEFTLSIYPPDSPTYTKDKSYLDICLADSRMMLDKDKLTTMD